MKCCSAQARFTHNVLIDVVGIKHKREFCRSFRADHLC